jgi:acyl carrier protein
VFAPDLDDSLRRAIATQLQVAPDDLTVERDLIALGLGDDDTAVALLEAVEELLDVRFPDDFLEGVETYGQLTSAVRVAIGV